MRRVYVWPVFAMALGTLLAAIGFDYSTWQYWAVFLLALAWVIADRFLESRHD